MSDMKITNILGAIITAVAITSMHATVGVDIPLYIEGGMLAAGLIWLVT